MPSSVPCQLTSWSISCIEMEALWTSSVICSEVDSISICLMAAWRRICLSASCHARLQSLHLTGAGLQVFAGAEVKDMPGHLMLYPYAVDQDGVVTAVTEFIPDSKKAKVLGQRSISLPCPLTT